MPDEAISPKRKSQPLIPKYKEEYGGTHRLGGPRTPPYTYIMKTLTAPPFCLGAARSQLLGMWEEPASVKFCARNAPRPQYMYAPRLTQ